MNINEEIQYDWKFGWNPDGMSEPRPKVNRLLKAMIEGNVGQMETLFSQGALLKEVNKETLERTLYHIINKYDVIRCMVKHGFNGFVGPWEFCDCIEPAGYIWGLPARAWYVGAYDVMDLLAREGYEKMSFCVNGERTYDGIKLMFSKNDICGIKILLENGYRRESIDDYKKEYPGSKVTEWLNNNPCVHRKYISLDNWKFKTIPEPELEKASFFNKSRVRKENEIKVWNYRDRIQAQEKFINKIGKDRWKRIGNQKI